MRLKIEISTPIERWNFGNLRARYQAILKTAGAEPAVENLVRAGLERLTQREQAAKADALI